MVQKAALMCKDYWQEKEVADLNADFLSRL
jgi:hypothetical protein